MTEVRPKKNLVFRATVLKTLGRVGSFFFLNWNLNYKYPNEKNGVLVKKSLGSAGSIGRVGLLETQDFF